MAKAKFIGVYASIRPSSVQPLSLAGKTPLWFVWEDGWGRYRVQLLDNTLQPADTPKVVSATEFKTCFLRQPKILATPISQIDVVPVSTQDKDAKSIAFIKENEVFTDFVPKIAPPTKAKKLAGSINVEDAVTEEVEEKAAELDLKVRSEFAVALAKWQNGDKVSPLKVFEKICNLEEGLIPAHKHMYTNFAIDLRKSNLPTMAVRHYKKAVDLSPEDSNAHFNLARIYYEMGKLDDAVIQLRVSLELSPDFELAAKFLQLIAHQQAKFAPNKGHRSTKKSKDNTVFNFG